VPGIAVRSFIEYAIAGIIVGSLYSFVAVGFVTLYKCTKVPNFAQGAFGVVAAYVTWWLITSQHTPFVLAALGGIAASGLTGYVADRIAMRRMLGAPVISLIIFTYGLDIVLTSGAQEIWGPQIELLKLPGSGSYFHVAGLSIQYTDVLIFIIGLLVPIAAWAFFKYTRLGMATRATATSRTWPSLLGINVPGVMSFSWTLAGVLGGLAGIFLSGIYYLEPSLMDTFLLPAFTAAALGGFGSIAGAYVGGLILGVAQDLSSGYLGASWTTYSAYIVLFIVLMIRPQGLFGTGLSHNPLA
jgi:branched-chain amino acid transport system permease protein